MGERLEGKVCIVTGAAQGIGAAYARALAREGADVAIIDLKRIDQAGPVKDDIEALGRRALVIEADVSDGEQMAAMGKQVVDTLGRVDCLGEQRRPDVRPADRDVGRLPRGELHGGHPRVERCAAVPLGATQRVDREHLVERGVPAVVAHAVPDAGRRARADARARGLRHDQVDDHPPDQDDGPAARLAEHPGERSVPGRDHVGATKAVVPGAIVDSLVETSVLKSSLEPEDMTGVVLFLAADESSKMSGQVLINDAGTWIGSV